MVDDYYKELYREYWNHARHQEWQRLTFTSGYIIAIAAVLGFIAQTGITNLTSGIGFIIFSFLTGISVIGFLLIHNWGVPFSIFTELTEVIAEDVWAIPNEHLRFRNKKLHNRFKLGNARHIFSVFYVVLTSTFATFATYFLIWNNPTIISEPVFYVIPCISFSVMLVIYWRKSYRPIKQISDIIRSNEALLNFLHIVTQYQQIVNNTNTKANSLVSKFKANTNHTDSIKKAKAEELKSSLQKLKITIDTAKNGLIDAKNRSEAITNMAEKTELLLLQKIEKIHSQAIENSKLIDEQIADINTIISAIKP